MSSAELVALFRKTPILDMGALERGLPGRSRRSLFRDLSVLDYLASYTHAGRHYALRAACPFDEHGVWRHRGIGFSRFGTLKSTVEYMVAVAVAGLTQEDLRVRLDVRVHNTLLDLVCLGRVRRVTVDGLYIYVSADPTLSQAQDTRRRELTAGGHEAPRPPPVSVELEVLLDVIRSVDLHVEAAPVAARLRARGISVTDAQVEEVLQRHALEKKTAPSPSLRSLR